MTRAGREPTEDVKRRLIAACQEVGLEVDTARMHLMKEHGYRLVHVGASPEEWPHETSMISVSANVSISGAWPKTVDIRCNASNDNALSGPWMKGRGDVPFEDLITELRETLNEREQVVALVQAGTPRPYAFTRSVWDTFDPLGGIDIGPRES
jgi:hypothetical protein